MAYGTINADKLVGSSGGTISPDSGVFRNRIINGAMVIDQRNAGASVTVGAAGGYYSVDRFYGQAAVASKFTLQQSTDVPSGQGFVNSLVATSSSTYSIGANDYFIVRQAIEGLNCYDFMFGSGNAKTVTLSFWAKSSLTGTFSGHLTNSSSGRWYPFTYSIPTANTWTQISVTISGDQSGTWLTNNSTGIYVGWSMGTGSGVQTTANAWTATAGIAATGSVNLVGTNGATFYITGVQLEKGSTATSFDYRSYGTELVLCQRYYEKSFPATWVPGTASFATGFVSTTSPSASPSQVSGARFIVPKRASPTIVVYNAVSGASGSLYRVSDGANVAATVNHVNEGAIGYIDVTANANGYYWHFTSSAEL